MAQVPSYLGPVLMSDGHFLLIIRFGRVFSVPTKIQYIQHVYLIIGLTIVSSFDKAW